MQPEFQDHHIIGINPIGWAGSSFLDPTTAASHEKNADEVFEMLKMLGLEHKGIVVGGYSTGGGIAFHLAHKYPETVSAAFLMHSIQLNGVKLFDPNDGSIMPGSADEIAESTAKMFSIEFTPDTIYE